MLIAALVASMPAWARELALVGLAGERAFVLVDGQRWMLSKGESKGGVRLVAIEAGAILLEVDGKSRRLRLGEHMATLPAEQRERLTIVADGRGHFVTQGAINGVPVRFLVDTGATMVALGAKDAQRAGIDPSKGEPGVTMTANGPVRVRKVRLPRLTLGDITLYDVEAAVHEGDLPLALLGMSALNRFEIRREGETMVLDRRY